MQARVNGGSNYDSLKVAKCLVILLVTRMNGLMRLSLSQLFYGKSTWKGTVFFDSAGKEDPFELDCMVPIILD